jgi:hypothetical protein
MTTYYFWFFLLAILVYLAATDLSVARLIDLTIKLGQFQYEKTKWWLIHNPRNPIVKYLMWRRAWKLAKELQNEIEMERQSRIGNDDSTVVK